ncbi:MAG: archaeal proteasome endopeptidase complex subunit alpha [Candidatus Woesearchaeota archaeon]
MEPGQHQMMGYDRAITMFSPDGRLLQVEYAKKTVKQGSSVIGLKTTDGIVIAADKRIVDKFIVPESIEKIAEIDEHIIASGAGILSDARILIERSQLRAQQHRLTYDTPIDTIAIVKDIANLKQMCTQSGGLRPFGVSLIIGGVDEKGPRLFITDPTGIYFEYDAVAIGEKETEITKILEEEYTKEITTEKAIQLGVSALARTLEGEISEKRIDVAYIKEGKCKKLSEAEIKKLLTQSKKK